MIRIESVTVESDPLLLNGVRALFRAYGDFLRSSGGHQSFRFDRLEKETLELPAAYTMSKGEVLAAMEGASVFGCIAYRAHPIFTGPPACEVKRLFVAAEFRARGAGSLLINQALNRAVAKGYRFACLDTDPGTMPAAHQTYLKAGFIEYDPPNSEDGSYLLYLCKPLSGYTGPLTNGANTTHQKHRFTG